MLFFFPVQFALAGKWQTLFKFSLLVFITLPHANRLFLNQSHQ